MNDQPSRTIAWWVSGPTILAAALALPYGLVTGYGVALTPILLLCAAAIWFGSRAFWRSAGPSRVLAGAGLGVLVGVAASTMFYGALALDARLGPWMGGSVVGSAMERAINTGLNAGVTAAQPGGAANVAMAPAVLVTAPAGAFAGLMVAVMVILAVCAATVLAGVVGGARAAAQARL
jgi:hypothetical protein